MATNNVAVLRTGTGWTVDVTPCNLLADLAVKDFVVLHNGVVASNADYAKTSQTILTYTGAALAANTPVEVRRATPTIPYQLIQYAQRFSSGDYNTEIDRIYRNLEEYELNGVGPGSLVTLATPVDQVFGVAWDGDTIRPPSRNSVYDDLILRPYNDNPTFTGTVTVPTPATADNTTKAASTAYVKSNLVSYAPLASPTFTGTPTAPTPATTTNNTTIATTAYVDAHVDARLRAIMGNGAANQALNNNASTLIQWTLGHHNPYSEVGGNVIVVNETGIYRLSVTIALQGVSGRCMGEFYATVGSINYGAARVFDGVSNQPGVAAGEFTYSGSVYVSLTVGANIGFRVFVNSTGVPIVTGTATFLVVERVA